MNKPIDPKHSIGSSAGGRRSGSLAEVLNVGDDGTFECLTTEDKLDISLQLIGLTDDQLAAGGLTRDGILDFVFGEKAFTALR